MLLTCEYISSSRLIAEEPVSVLFNGYEIVENAIGHLFVGTEGDGLIRSTDYGNTFFYTGLYGCEVEAVMITSSGAIFSGVRNVGLYRSLDNGDSWESITEGLSDSITNIYYMLEIDSTGYIFMSSDDGLWFSDNQGDSWARAGFEGNTVRDIMLLPNGKLIVLVQDGGAYFSETGEFNWQLLHPDSLHYLLIRVALLGDGSLVFGTWGQGLYHLSANYITWSNISSGIGNGYVNQLVHDSAGNLYACVHGYHINSQSHGVYQYDANLNIWNRAFPNLPADSVKDIHFSQHEEIFAVTWYYHGFFRSTGNDEWMRLNNNNWVTKVDETFPQAAAISVSVAPNPFNPSTEIEVILPETADIALHIFNINGQQIYTINDSNARSGIHRYRWNGLMENGQQAGSGTYYVRVETSIGAKTAKMTLIR